MRFARTIQFVLIFYFPVFILHGPALTWYYESVGGMHYIAAWDAAGPISRSVLNIGWLAAASCLVITVPKYRSLAAKGWQKTTTDAAIVLSVLMLALGLFVLVSQGSTPRGLI